jgi:hypothetical protein
LAVGLRLASAVISFPPIMKHLAHYVCVSVTVIGFAFIAVRLLLRFGANIRNAFGIKKDLLETEKVEQAVQDQVKNFDPKTVRVIHYVAQRKGTFLRTRPLDFQFWFAVLFLVLIMVSCFMRR